MLEFSASDNPVLLKFFEKYPKTHILKFFIDHKLHRFIKLMLLKLVYLFLFKVIFQLKLRDVDKLIIKSKYVSEPILIVQNHCSRRDVLILMAVWAHLGKVTSALSSTFIFSPKKRLSCVFSHFFEMIPMFGTGEDVVKNITKRLIKGDFIAIFPEGTQPAKGYSNTGFIQEIFTGAARIAHNYWNLTGKKLLIQPSCSIGANNVFPPRDHKQKIKKNKIILKFGDAFSLNFSNHVDYDEIQEKTKEIANKMLKIWGQKKLIPNYSFGDRRTFFNKSGKYRVYTTL